LEIDAHPCWSTFPTMVALKTKATVDRGRTLAVMVPECGMEAGEYEVLVVLDAAKKSADVTGHSDGQAWLQRAAGSAVPGITTDAILSASRGED
jgi:hypothetical protein